MSLIKLLEFKELDRTVLYERSELEATFLPVGAMLQVDRVLKIEGSTIICEMDLSNHWAFQVHFPADPIFPGSLLLEASGQTAALWAWHAGLRGKPRLVKVSARFEGAILPEDHSVTFQGSIRQRRKVCLATVRAFVAERRVATFDLTIIILSSEESPAADN